MFSVKIWCQKYRKQSSFHVKYVKKFEIDLIFNYTNISTLKTFIENFQLQKTTILLIFRFI